MELMNTSPTGALARAVPGSLRILLLLEADPAATRDARNALPGRGDRVVGDVITSLREVTAERLAEVDCVVIEPEPADPDGLQALRRVRDLVPELPVVVLAGVQHDATAASTLDHGAQENPVTRLADGDGILRAAHLARARRRRQARPDGRPAPDSDLCDDVVQQLFAIGLAMRTTQRRCGDQPEVAARIAEHMDGLQRVIQQIRSTALDPRAVPAPPSPAEGKNG